MANNRLYLIDTETKEKILLCKGFGDGWYIWHSNEELNNWLGMRDYDVSSGTPGESKLIVMAENDPRFSQYDSVV